MQHCLAQQRMGPAQQSSAARGWPARCHPRYVDFKEAIRSEMLIIKAKMGELRGLHGKAALTTFDDTGR